MEIFLLHAHIVVFSDHLREERDPYLFSSKISRIFTHSICIPEFYSVQYSKFRTKIIISTSYFRENNRINCHSCFTSFFYPTHSADRISPYFFCKLESIVNSQIFTYIITSLTEFIIKNSISILILSLYFKRSGIFTTSDIYKNFRKHILKGNIIVISLRLH